MEFRILGPFEVVGPDGDVLELGSTRERALLALLVVHANEVLSLDRIIDELWPDRAPETAAKIVQVYVSHLRKALGEARDLLETRPPGYVLRLGTGSTDVERCEQLVDAAAAATPAQRAGLLRDALGVWRGDDHLETDTWDVSHPCEVVRPDGARVRPIHRIQPVALSVRGAGLDGEGTGSLTLIAEGSLPQFGLA